MHPLRFPRGIPAASLKHTDARLTTDLDEFSAGNTRGLIEAMMTVVACPGGSCGVFRGEYPRPH